MAAGLVYHNITTSSGVTFTFPVWVPDTASPDVHGFPVKIAFDTAGNEVLTAAQVTAALGYIDGIETRLDALHTDLATTLAAYVDGLEGILGTTSGAAVITDANGTIQQYLRGLIKQWIAGTLVLGVGSNVIGKVGIDQSTPGTTDRVTVGGIALVDVTLSLDTSAYASGDLLADTQVVSSALRVNDGKGILHSVTVIDEDDQGVAFDLYFLSANNTLGSENSAPSISDANARDILTKVSIATTDYYDLGGVRVAEVHGLNRVIKAASGSTSIYVAAVNGTGTPTFTASGLKLRVGIIQD